MRSLSPWGEGRDPRRRRGKGKALSGEAIRPGQDWRHFTCPLAPPQYDGYGKRRYGARYGKKCPKRSGGDRCPSDRISPTSCVFSARLVIELDGGQHAEAIDYDDRPTAFIEAQGHRVLRFWNTEVTANLPGVLEAIAAVLARKSPSPDGRGAGIRPGGGEGEPHPPTPLRSAGPSLSRTGEGKSAQLSASSSSNVTATSALALRRTVPPSIVATRPVEM